METLKSGMIISSVTHIHFRSKLFAYHSVTSQVKYSNRLKIYEPL